MNQLDDRHIGCFSIPLVTIKMDPGAARAALCDVIVLEARTAPWSMEIEYVGIHPSFDEISSNDVVPYYRAVCQAEMINEKGVTVGIKAKFLRWERVPEGEAGSAILLAPADPGHRVRDPGRLWGPK